MHEVHFMTLAIVNGRRGWIAPLESPKETQQAGTLVVPVDAGGKFFSRYCLAFVKYLGQGQTIPNSSIIDLQPSGFLNALINGRDIRFQIRIAGGNPVIHEYVGTLTHSDFRFPLAEIEPESEQQLDDLYSRDRIVVVGCDPPTNYRGMDSIK